MKRSNYPEESFYKTLRARKYQIKLLLFYLPWRRKLTDQQRINQDLSFNSLLVLFKDFVQQNSKHYR